MDTSGGCVLVPFKSAITLKDPFIKIRKEVMTGTKLI